jgi:hypothetical protein
LQLPPVGSSARSASCTGQPLPVLSHSPLPAIGVRSVGRGAPQSRTTATHVFPFLQSVFLGRWSLGWSALGQQHSLSSSSIFVFSIASESLQGEVGINLESPDQKPRGLLV